jgi:hypothetical protein
MNDVAAGAHASGFLNIVGCNPEHRAAINRAGRNQARLRMGTLAGFDWLWLGTRRLGHANNIEQPASGFRFSAGTQNRDVRIGG